MERWRVADDPSGVENQSRWVQYMWWAALFDGKDKRIIYLASLMARPNTILLWNGLRSTRKSWSWHPNWEARKTVLRDFVLHQNFSHLKIPLHSNFNSLFFLSLSFSTIVKNIGFLDFANIRIHDISSLIKF